MRYLEIAGRKVGSEYSPLVIAEIGINHNGDLGIAKEMVDSAKKAGAEIVKFQSHVIADEMSHHAKESVPGNADISIYDIMASCTLNADEEQEIKKYVESLDMIFLSTPFSRAAADRLQAMDVQAFKIGSGECNNFPLVKHIAEFGKPIILSTGMNSMDSITKTVGILTNKKVPHALLHCTNVYPTPPELVRLGGMAQLMEAFPETVIGLSDHTLNNAACLAAIGMGADILERHFTDSKDREGPDICCSMTPDELTQLHEWGNEIVKMRGGTKGPAEAEAPTINFAFSSVVSIRDIEKGEVFSKDNSGVKRPGTGELSADDFDAVIGKTATCDIGADQQLKRSEISK
ncbi:MAG: N-acetylneuraminate synthase family protein [Planctomycetota bacterium]|nr:N-acetylneuraminate synthase family protein [Planctomycetota bacterium]